MTLDRKMMTDSHILPVCKCYDILHCLSFYL